MRPLSATDPRAVARYRLLGVLGGGGMGRVYLGQSPAGRPLAIKVIRSDLADDPVFRQRFTREVAAVRAVSPLFTAAVIDADTEADPPWLATTYIEGPSLRDWVGAHGPLCPGAALILAAGLAEALSSIHTSGLVHRDLKPSNVLLDDAGPRIIDFGIAVSPESTRLTTSIVGTPSYLAPELVGGGEPEPASDIFSLGATLVFATTGVPLVHDGTMLQQLVQISTARFDLSAVPRELRAIVVRCLSRRPRDRPTADELVRVLVGAGLPTPEPAWYRSQAPAPARVMAPARVPRRRVLVLSGLTGLALAAGGAGVAAALERDRRTGPPAPGSVLWLVNSGAPAPTGPPPAHTGAPSDRIVVDPDNRLVTATGGTVSAIDRQGRSLWRRALTSGPLALRPWRGSILVTNAASAWLLDPATGRPRFTAAGAAHGIGEVALSGTTAFLDLGTAVGALDDTGRWAWRRDGLGTPLAADSTTLVTRTATDRTVQVTLADPRTGVPRWTIHYPVPAPLPAPPPPDGRGADGPPPDGAPPPEGSPRDPAWTRSQARLGAGMVALRDAHALRVVRGTDGQTVWQSDSTMPVAGIELTGDLLLVCADKVTARSLGTGGQAWEAPVRGARLAVSDDGGTIVAADEQGVTALDRYGATRWHTPLPTALTGAMADRVTITDSAAIVTFRPGPDRRTALNVDVLALAR